jgi:hypothetical protein
LQRCAKVTTPLSPDRSPVAYPRGGIVHFRIVAIVFAHACLPAPRSRSAAYEKYFGNENSDALVMRMMKHLLDQEPQKIILSTFCHSAALRQRLCLGEVGAEAFKPSAAARPLNQPARNLV